MSSALHPATSEATKLSSATPSNEVIEAAEAAKAKYGPNPLVTAADKQDEEAVKALLAAGYKDLEERDLKWGNTPLIVAADVGLDSSVKALLAAGANKDARSTSNGRTALMVAACYGKEGCVRLLVEAGADRNMKDNSGESALDLASTEAIKAMLR